MSLSPDSSSTKASQGRQQFFYSAVLLVCCLLSPIFFSEIGIVGEVYIGAHAQQVPDVLDQSTAMGLNANPEGIIQLEATRPMLRAQIGDHWWPLMINTYTGGFADWPGRLFMTLGGLAQHGRWFYSLWGGLSCILIFAMLQRHLRIQLAFWAALLVALAWDLSLYRTALAGTEQLLQLVCALSVLLMLRQETGFKWLILVCIGAFTKITFLLSLVPICIIMIFQRRVSALRWMTIGLLIGVAPFFLTSLPTEIPSHDGLSLQLERMLRALHGDNTGSREQWHNLTLWLFNPQGFWAEHYQLDAPPIPVLKGLGVLLLGGFTAACWRHTSPYIREVRTLACLSVLQASLLTWLAKDSHHLAPVHISLAIWLAFLVAHLTTQKESWTNLARYSLLLIWPLGALQLLAQTPTLWSTLDQHGLSDRTQAEICRSLEEIKPQTIMTLDYEIYGVIESRCPNHAVKHAWGLIAQIRQDAIPLSIKTIKPTHLLVFSDSPNWVYNLKPNLEQLQRLLPDHLVTTSRDGDQFRIYEINKR